MACRVDRISELDRSRCRLLDSDRRAWPFAALRVSWSRDGRLAEIAKKSSERPASRTAARSQTINYLVERVDVSVVEMVVGAGCWRWGGAASAFNNSTHSAGAADQKFLPPVFGSTSTRFRFLRRAALCCSASRQGSRLPTRSPPDDWPLRPGPPTFDPLYWAEEGQVSSSGQSFEASQSQCEELGCCCLCLPVFPNSLRLGQQQ